VHGEGRKQAYIGNKLSVLTRSVVPFAFVGRRLININQALMGFEKNVTHLDGRTLQIVRKAVTQPGMPFFSLSLQDTRFSTFSVGFVQVVKGEGMPSFGSKSSNGDLFIEYNVVLPVELTPDMRRSESRLNLINLSP
jgi:DnaJ-related protein SCJ1